MQQQTLQLLSTVVSLLQQVYEVWLVNVLGAKNSIQQWAVQTKQQQHLITNYN